MCIFTFSFFVEGWGQWVFFLYCLLLLLLSLLFIIVIALVVVAFVVCVKNLWMVTFVSPDLQMPLQISICWFHNILQDCLHCIFENFRQIFAKIFLTLPCIFSYTVVRGGAPSTDKNIADYFKDLRSVVITGPPLEVTKVGYAPGACNR